MIDQLIKCMISLTLSASACTAGNHFTPTQDELPQEIETIIDQAELGRFWGVIEVRVGDETILSRGYGFENSNLEKISTQTSLFDVGSISKSITAAAILKLIEEEKLTLSTTISEIFGETAGTLSQVTIEQLLRHQSGLGHAQGMFAHREAMNSADSLVTAAGRVTLGSKEFAYSNPGYHVLAAIIEHLGSDSFEETTRKLVFNNAQLKAIGFVGDGQVADANPTVRIKQNRSGQTTQDTLFDYPWNWGQRGATGVVMTAQTAANWFEAIETGDWLSDTSRIAMLSPNANGYGLGLYVDTNEDGVITRFWHGGSTGGYVCHAARYPLAFDGKGATIILMTQSTINLRPITDKIHRLIQPPASKPTFAGIYLNNLDEYETDGVYTIDQGLKWTGKTQYIGSDGKNRIVDQRPTLILKHQDSRMWTLIIRMDRDKAQSLIEKLSKVMNTIANDPEGGASAWSKGTTLIADTQGLALTEYNSYLIEEGAIITVRASDDHHEILVITTPDSKHEIARIRMGGSETRQLQAQLKSAMR